MRLLAYILRSSENWQEERAVAHVSPRRAWARAAHTQLAPHIAVRTTPTDLVVSGLLRECGRRCNLHFSMSQPPKAPIRAGGGGRRTHFLHALGGGALDTQCMAVIV